MALTVGVRGAVAFEAIILLALAAAGAVQGETPHSFDFSVHRWNERGRRQLGPALPPLPPVPPSLNTHTRMSRNYPPIMSTRDHRLHRLVVTEP